MIAAPAAAAPAATALLTWTAAAAPLSRKGPTAAWSTASARTIPLIALAAWCSRHRQCKRPHMAAVATRSLVKDSGLLLIEHLNLNVSSTPVALEFYEALGCRRDARRPMTKTLHSNCGALTQFHTPSPENEAFIAGAGPQQWRGCIELRYADVSQLRAAEERLRRLQEQEHFRDTCLAVEWQEDLQELRLRGPYGNSFRLSVATEELAAGLRPGTGRPGSEGCQVLGMAALTLQVPVGAAAPGANFYAEMLGCAVEERPNGAWAVLGGPMQVQELLLEEQEGCTGKELGEHMAIYVRDFDACFERLLARGLIWVNPRFVHLDKSTTLEEAQHYSCFRFKDVVAGVPTGT
ncbi:unnamed protein product [Effrenium voratum]|uniref:VOC domain-containing protein n=1 Tax=Effrenium voratum TaxID=2562239 RepID=A0AA36JD20_9DINO|nr:unnamed protein product [Effrenium voratum]